MFGKKKRRPNKSLLTQELIHLIAIASVELDSKSAKAVKQWGIGSADRWSSDLVAGTLTFDFSDHAITGPVEFIGSYSTSSQTRMWGWANESVPASVKSASEATRAYGSKQNLRALTEGKIGNLDPSLANDLAAVTVEIANLAGLYHAPTKDGFIFLGFTDFQVA
jgi:hypothetical protein